MADLDAIATRVGDVAQRIADVSDALRGKGVRVGGGNGVARWLVMPAAAPEPTRRRRDEEPPAREWLPLGERRGDDGQSSRDLDVHLQERAERRRRRRGAKS